MKYEPKTFEDATKMRRSRDDSINRRANKSHAKNKAARKARRIQAH